MAALALTVEVTMFTHRQLLPKIVRLVIRVKITFIIRLR